MKQINRFGIAIVALLVVNSYPSIFAQANRPTTSLPKGVSADKRLSFNPAQWPDFSTLFSILKTAGLLDKAAQPGQYTAFAPTNGAFDELPDGTLTSLLRPANKTKLLQFLAYHVVKGRLTSDRLHDGQTLTNLVGRPLVVHKQGNTITIEDGRANVADVVQADIRAASGVVYSINKVLQRNVK